MRIRVFAIDDEASILETIKDSLPAAEFSVQGAKHPLAGLEAIERIQPDIVLLDWNLPVLSGFEACSRLRKNDRTREIAVIMLTVVDRTLNKVNALESGADDYITKPFEPAELAARIKAVLRRRGAGVVPSALLKRGALEIDGASYTAKVDGKPLELSTTEFEILYLLACRENRTLTREVILEHTCAQTTETLRAVDVHVGHIRRKLGPKASGYIRTVHRLGYLFSAR